MPLAANSLIYCVPGDFIFKPKLLAYYITKNVI